MSFWDFSFADLILGSVTIILSVIYFLLPYRQEYSGPTRKEFSEFVESYKAHLKDDLLSFERLHDELNQVRIQTAVLLERIDNVKETLESIERNR